MKFNVVERGNPSNPAAPKKLKPVHRIQRTRDHAPTSGANCTDFHRFQRGYNGGAGSPADHNPTGIISGQHRGIGRFRQFLAESQRRRCGYRRCRALQPDHHAPAALQCGQGIQEGAGYH